MKILEDGRYDYTSLIDPIRFAKVILEENRRKAEEFNIILDLVHRCYAESDLTAEKVAQIKTLVGYTDPQSGYDNALIMKQNDVVGLNTFLDSLVQSSSSSVDDDPEVVESVKGEEYDYDDVVSQLDESYVSNVCYITALECIASGETYANSSNYMAHLPQSIRNSMFIDQYATYYANIIDDSTLTEVEKVGNVIQMASTEPIGLVENFSFMVNYGDYTGITPLQAWIAPFAQAFNRGWEYLTQGIVGVVKFAVDFFKGIINFFKPVVSYVVESFHQDAFKENSDSEAAQNLIDVPFVQVKVPVSSVLIHPVTISEFPNLHFKSMLASFLDKVTVSDDEARALLSTMFGMFPRIEIPLKGVSYFLSYLQDSDEIFIQIYVGMLSDCGVGDYFKSTNGKGVTFNSDYISADSIYYVGYDNSAAGTKSYVDNQSNTCYGYNINDLLSSFEPEFIDDISNRSGYVALRNACYMSLLYPVVMVHSYIPNGRESQDSNVPAEYYKHLWMINRCIEASGWSSDKFLPRKLDFFNLSNDQDWGDPTNLNVISVLNFNNLSGQTISQDNEYAILDIICYLLSTILAGTSRLKYNVFKLNTLIPDARCFAIQNSSRYPVTKYRVCTDADNKEKFKVVGTAAASLIGIIAGGAIIGKVVKSLTNGMLTAQSSYLSVIKRLSEVSPGSAEYKTLLTRARKLRRSLRRYSLIGMSTGITVSTPASLITALDDLQLKDVVSLIKG